MVSLRSARRRPNAFPLIGRSPLIVGSTTNMADLVAESDWRVKEVRERDRTAQDAQDALTRTPEQQRLFMAYEQVDNDRDFEQMDLYIAELSRHLPGLHTGIWALWQHVIESRRGCCMPDRGDEP